MLDDGLMAWIKAGVFGSIAQRHFFRGADGPFPGCCVSARRLVSAKCEILVIRHASAFRAVGRHFGRAFIIVRATDSQQYGKRKQRRQTFGRFSDVHILANKLKQGGKCAMGCCWLVTTACGASFIHRPGSPDRRQ